MEAFEDHGELVQSAGTQLGSRDRGPHPVSPPRVSPGQACCCPYPLLTRLTVATSLHLTAHSWFLAELNWKLEEAQSCLEATGHLQKGFFYILLISSGNTTRILGVSLNPESEDAFGVGRSVDPRKFYIHAHRNVPGERVHSFPQISR